MVVNPQEPQAVVQGATALPVTSHQPRATITTGTGRGSAGNGGIPSAQEVLNLIASKYLQEVRPSKPEEFNNFLRYLKKVRKVLFVGAQPGSLIVTVKCSSVQILDDLWEDYCSGHLNEVAQKFLVTDEILEELALTEVKLASTVLEEEYRTCREYIVEHLGMYIKDIIRRREDMNFIFECCG